jgi:hypothetical protein
MQGLVGKPEERRPLGRLKRRLEDAIGTDHREIGWGGGGGDLMAGWHKIGTGGGLLLNW